MVCPPQNGSPDLPDLQPSRAGPLDDRRLPLSDADAQGREPVVRPPFRWGPPAHLMDEGAHDPRAAAPERVAQRDGTAFHVRNLVAEPELAHHEEGLDREPLVQLHEPAVLHAPLRAGERLPPRGYRAEAHRPRLD